MQQSGISSFAQRRVPAEKASNERDYQWKRHDDCIRDNGARCPAVAIILANCTRVSRSTPTTVIFFFIFLCHGIWYFFSAADSESRERRRMMIPVNSYITSAKKGLLERRRGRNYYILEFLRTRPCEEIRREASTILQASISKNKP